MTMYKNYDSLLETDFVPVAEAKAKLSEKIRQTLQGKRIAITSNGRPQALLLSYQDYLELIRSLGTAGSLPVKTIDIEKWKRGKAKRKKIRDSIVKHFHPERLPRKGQKEYKRETVRGFQRRTKK